jgi:flagellin-like hook-associated protein FlgL
MSTRSYCLRVVVCFAGLVLAACGDDPQVPTASTPVASATWSGRVAVVLQEAPSVRITDQKGKNIKGLLVRWRVITGGGRVSSDTVRTDANGVSTGVGFFQALDQLTAAVQGSSRMNMQRGIGEMDALQNGLTLALAQVGTDMNVADAQTAVLEETRLSLKTTLSNIEDLDYAEAIGQMNKQMLSLEAAQSSFGKISKLNLFNYLN